MDEFEDACRKGYLAIRKHSRQVIQMLEMSSFSGGAGTALPCLEGDALVEVTKRLKLDSTDRDAELVCSPPSLRMCGSERTMESVMLQNPDFVALHST